MLAVAEEDTPEASPVPPKTLIPEVEDAAGQEAAPPDAEQVYRGVAKLVAWFCPGARDVCITYRAPGQSEPGRIPVPAVPAGDDFEGLVVAVLARLRPGERMKGRSIAAELDMDHEGGYFRKAMARLAKDGVIDSDNHRGYCLPTG